MDSGLIYDTGVLRDECDHDLETIYCVRCGKVAGAECHKCSMPFGSDADDDKQCWCEGGPTLPYRPELQ